MLNILNRSLRMSRLCRFFGTQRMKLPKFGDSVEEVTMTNYLIEPGEYVFEDDDIIEVESQKGTTKIKSSLSGMISSYLVEIDDDFNVGDEYCEVDIDAPKPEKKVAAPSVAAETAKEVKQDAPAPTPKKEAKPAPAPAPKTPKVATAPLEGKVYYY